MPNDVNGCDLGQLDPTGVCVSLLMCSYDHPVTVFHKSKRSEVKLREVFGHKKKSFLM